MTNKVGQGGSLETKETQAGDLRELAQGQGMLLGI